MSSARAVDTATPRQEVVPAPRGEEAARELAGRPVTPRRHYGWWIASVVVLALLAELVLNIAHNDAWEWGRFGHYFTLDVVRHGVFLTLELTALSAVLGLVGGVVLALARLSGNGLFSGLSWLYIWFFRSLPLNVLLILLFNLAYFFPHVGLKLPFLPTLFGHDTVSMAPFAWGLIGLSLNEAAFAAELIRGGILSVDPGQIEAANALGLPPSRRLRRVVLPQALRTIVPGYVNQLVGLVKGTSLVYFVSLVDLFGIVNQLESTNPQDVVPILMVGVAWYLVIAAVLTVVQFYVERFFARGAVRTLPRTPFQRLVDGLKQARLRLAEAVTR
ncbi:amino acid ABC transporter permease [Nocardioides sp. BP30]|uniref:amino acid ABC transporter permease n=1 Tax=Nocardioides sp. BP30 TaxID=3036374 RepID=UPI0024685B3A|nr:amino acid ABC transporter permease [Nocardioides sp. BP30]WGL52708.1 amino acid ABC transporter permease [Nocardioides sp. BP30]